jgi:hypothetical protein
MAKTKQKPAMGKKVTLPSGKVLTIDLTRLTARRSFEISKSIKAAKQTTVKPELMADLVKKFNSEPATQVSILEAHHAILAQQPVSDDSDMYQQIINATYAAYAGIEVDEYLNMMVVDFNTLNDEIEKLIKSSVEGVEVIDFLGNGQA